MHNTVTVATPPVINQGVNAGQPQNRSDYALDRLALTKTAVLRLKHSGFDVIDVSPMERFTPVVMIENCARCGELHGETVKWWFDEYGPFQLMEAKLDGVRVVWKVRGH